MDPKIKEAFDKVKEDLNSLFAELQSVRNEKDLMRESFDNKIVYALNHFSGLINDKIFSLDNKLRLIMEGMNEMKELPLKSADNELNPTIQQINPTIQQSLKPLKDQNILLSIGNRGVPTDTPTNNPTHQQTADQVSNLPFLKENNPPTKKDDKGDDFDQAIKILESLDGIKKEIRRKFKQLTPMEMQVFSVLYSLEENGEEPDYRLIASKLSLSESSIRDYIGRIIIKGIPITKEKLNNKKIILKVSPDLKKITSLDAIIQLRGL